MDNSNNTPRSSKNNGSKQRRRGEARPVHPETLSPLTPCFEAEMQEIRDLIANDSNESKKDNSENESENAEDLENQSESEEESDFSSDEDPEFIDKNISEAVIRHIEPLLKTVKNSYDDLTNQIDTLANNMTILRDQHDTLA